MKTDIFTLTENKKIAKNTFLWTLKGDISHIRSSGQFVNILLDGFFLRRPISVCDAEDGSLTLIFKAVGKGTEKMSRMKVGETVDVLTGLGNGYSLKEAGESPLLIGGGAGVPPMYMLAKKLIEKGARPTVILGFGSSDEVFFEEEFKALGARVIVATADGSYGVRGFVTDAMQGVDYSYFYTCGPEPMLKAVYDKSVTSGQFSFEERMGCGFGACMGCSCKTKYGNKRICRDGPVLVKEEIIW